MSRPLNARTASKLCGSLLVGVLAFASVPVPALAQESASEVATAAQAQTAPENGSQASRNATGTCGYGSDAEPADNKLIVTYKPKANLKGIVKDADIDTDGTKKLASDMDGHVISSVTLDDGQDSEEAIKKLQADPQVASVEANRTFHTLASVNDEFAADSYYLNTEGIASAWDYAKAQGKVAVAVLDTGITRDAAYPDEDLAGTVDYDNAYDAVKGRALSRSFVDTDGHGTAVASLISAQANNSVGIAGVSYNARIVPVRVVEDSGEGDTEEVIRGYEYVLKVAKKLNIKVVNMSLGGNGPDDYLPSLQLCINEAYDQGILTVAAAGNEAKEGNPVEYPAALEHVVSVGAVDSKGKVADFSEHNRFVDLTAAGVGILVPQYWSSADGDNNGSGTGEGFNWWFPWKQSAASVATKAGTQYLYDADNYSYEDGTSFSAPIVSGIAALLYTYNPTATASEVEQALEQSATDRGPAGRDNKYGYGEVNAQAALEALGGVAAAQRTFKSQAPRITSKKAGKNRIALKWRSVNGASGYVVSYRIKGKKAWKTTTVASAKTTKTLKKLKRKTSYQMRVQAYQSSSSSSPEVWSRYSKTATAKTK